MYQAYMGTAFFVCVKSWNSPKGRIGQTADAKEEGVRNTDLRTDVQKTFEKSG